MTYVAGGDATRKKIALDTGPAATAPPATAPPASEPPKLELRGRPVATPPAALPPATVPPPADNAVPVPAEQADRPAGRRIRQLEARVQKLEESVARDLKQ